jgi:hypothetical protein
MKPGLHVALLAAVMLFIPFAIGFVVWTGDETCGSATPEDTFHCTDFAQTLGLVLLYGSLLVGVVLVVYGVVRVVAWVSRLSRKTRDSN